MVRLPLEGIRVIDSSYVFALPYAASMMAALGAEVIKIEGPGRIDISRAGAFAGIYADNDPREDPWNRTASYNMINRGKKSLVLDLTKDEGLEALKDLVRVSDIFLENFTPRVMRRWGLDYPNMKKLKPDIIMVSNTGYGHGDGPYSEYPAQATTQEATHGLAYITGYHGDIPSKAGPVLRGLPRLLVLPPGGRHGAETPAPDREGLLGGHRHVPAGVLQHRRVHYGLDGQRPAGRANGEPAPVARSARLLSLRRRRPVVRGIRG